MLTTWNRKQFFLAHRQGRKGSNRPNVLRAESVLWDRFRSSLQNGTVQWQFKTWLPGFEHGAVPEPQGNSSPQLSHMGLKPRFLVGCLPNYRDNITARWHKR
jgi:hypothetical protein